MYSIAIDFLKYKKDLKIRREDEKSFIFDVVRRKYYRLLPEEFVRQLCLLYMINEKGYSKSLISVEKEIKFIDQVRRYDILALTNNNKPFFLVECKSPNVRLTQKVLDQISHYNLKLKVPYLFITNGKNSFCFALNKEQDKYLPIDEVPSYKAVSK